MSLKTIPFKKSDQKMGLKVDSKGSKDDGDGIILDHGELSGLNYEIYKRGVIHIFKDGEKERFKMGLDLFETELKNIAFDAMKEGEEQVIKGSGENDHLVFTKENGTVSLSIRKRTFSVVEQLKSIIKKQKIKRS